MFVVCHDEKNSKLRLQLVRSFVIITADSMKKVLLVFV